MYFDGFPSFDSQCEIIKYNKQKKIQELKIIALPLALNKKTKTSKHKNKIIYWISLPIDLFSREL